MQYSKSTVIVMAMAIVSAMPVAASATAINTLNFSQGWGPADNRFTGSTSIVASPSNDGDGAVKLSTANANDKATVSFFLPGSAPLGTLGQLVNGGSISFESMRDAVSTTATNQQIAFKMYVRNASGQGASLTWEDVYNGNHMSSGTWINNTLSDEKFWIRSGSNFDQVANMKLLSEWATGDTPSGAIVLGNDTVITGLELAAGSGWTGSFSGYLDNVNVSFGGGNTYNSNFQAVPEPATMAVMGFGALAVAARKRRRK